MSQFTFYRSTDTSAPTLTGQVGSLIALLDAILVNGYGSQSAAGWSHAFTTSGNVAAYKLGAGTGRFLSIDDSGGLTGGARDCIVRGFETMTALSTGTGPFPNPVQQSNGVNWRKSLSADGTARAWSAIADNRTLYLLVTTGDTSNTTGTSALYAFGDFYSYVPNDPYNCMLIGAIGSGTTETFTSTLFYTGDLMFNSVASSSIGHYLNRTGAGVGCSQPFYKKGAGHLVASGANIQYGPKGILAFPNGSDGDLHIHPIWVMDAYVQDTLRGELRGCWHQVHAITNFADQDTFGGDPSGNISGKSFVIFKQSPNTGVYVFETSNTVNTN